MTIQDKQHLIGQLGSKMIIRLSDLQAVFIIAAMAFFSVDAMAYDRKRCIENFLAHQNSYEKISEYSQKIHEAQIALLSDPDIRYKSFIPDVSMLGIVQAEAMNLQFIIFMRGVGSFQKSVAGKIDEVVDSRLMKHAHRVKVTKASLVYPMKRVMNSYLQSLFATLDEEIDLLTKSLTPCDK